jgi:hypothetical protein
MEVARAEEARNGETPAQKERPRRRRRPSTKVLGAEEPRPGGGPHLSAPARRGPEQKRPGTEKGPGAEGGPARRWPSAEGPGLLSPSRLG